MLTGKHYINITYLVGSLGRRVFIKNLAEGIVRLWIGQSPLIELDGLIGWDVNLRFKQTCFVSNRFNVSNSKIWLVDLTNQNVYRGSPGDATSRILYSQPFFC